MLLQRDLAEREAAVRGQAERLADLESRQAVAAAAAASFEARLAEARAEAEAAREEARRMAREADVARMTANRWGRGGVSAGCDLRTPRALFPSSFVCTSARGCLVGW